MISSSIRLATFVWKSISSISFCSGEDKARPIGYNIGIQPDERGSFMKYEWRKQEKQLYLPDEKPMLVVMPDEYERAMETIGRKTSSDW